MELAEVVCEGRRTPGDILAARVEKLAAALDGAGLGVGSSIAILMRNSPEFIEATLAGHRLGAYVTPLNWHWTAEELSYVLADSDARVVVGQADLLDGARASLPDKTLVLVVGDREPGCAWTAYEDFLRSGAHPPPPRAAPDSVIYTSGTTGRPKGVMRGAPTPAEALWVVKARNALYDLRPSMRGLLAAPLYHAAPNQFGIFAAQQPGALLVLHPRFDPERFLADVQEHGITHAYMAPAMFTRLLALPEAQRRSYDVSSLRFVTHAGGPCPPQIKSRMIEWWGPIIHEYYGGTELGPVSLCSPTDAATAPGSVGRVLDGVTLKILDAAGNEVGDGEVGELFVHTPYFAGFTYRNDPERRAEIERDGLVSLGDLGRRDAEGYLYLVDRKRDMIISGGVNIYCAEIEGALLSLPGVADCAVFGVPDEAFGEAPHALVQPADGADLHPGRLRAALEGKIARYKIPKAIELRRTLPRDEAGKIRKAQLREPYWAHAGRRI